MPLHPSDRILFFGDSITYLGMEPHGYVALIQHSLLKKYPSVKIIGSGISGNRVPDLLQRVDRDVLAHQPTIVVLYIGINDVWHSVTPGLSGTSKEHYAAGLQTLVTTIQNSTARVILCTPTVIGEKKNGANTLDASLNEYAAISRRIAGQTNCELCDLRKAFIEYLQTHNPHNIEQGILTVDAVHLNDEGNRLVANEILRLLDR